MDIGLRIQRDAGMTYYLGGVRVTWNGNVHELLTPQLSDKELDAHRTQSPHKARQLEWANSVKAEHRDRFGVIAVKHRSAVAGTPPQRLLSERKLVVFESYGHIGIEQTEARNIRGRPLGSRRCEIRLRNRGLSLRRERRNGSTALILTPHIKGKPSCLGAQSSTAIPIHTLSIRPAEIVFNRSSKVVA